MSQITPKREADRRTSTIDVPLVAAMAAMPLILIAGRVPQDLLLPSIAALAFALAAVAAAYGWLTRAGRCADAVTIWDFAGACLFIGIAAGTFSAPDQISQFFGVAHAAP